MEFAMSRRKASRRKTFTSRNPSRMEPLETRVLLSASVNFLPQQTYIANADSYGFVTADFDGDGKTDLAIPSISGNTDLLLGNGDGTFKNRVSVATGNSCNSLAAGDFNGDGRPDLAVVNDGANTVSIVLGNGDGTFGARQTFGTGRVPYAIVCSDFNGDGKIDLALTNWSDNNISVLLGNGNGTFQAQQTFACGAFPFSLATGDFNGDHVADLVIANFINGTAGVLLGNGDGTFQAQQTYAVGSSPISIISADFNGDGKADLAAACGSSASILLGNGDGSFQARQSYAVGNSPTSVTAADLNGDGKLDLAVANNIGNAHDTVSVLMGVGDGTFLARQPFATGNYSRVARAADFNGDGAPDLAVTNYSDGTVSILLQTGPAVSGVSATTADGAYKAGDVIAVTVTFGDNVTVNTAGGTPSLTLNDGGTAVYASGSGTDTLTFNYTVGAGENAADLDYGSTGALSLNGGSIKYAGMDAVLTLASPGAAGSLGANNDIVIDNTAPVVTVDSLTSADNTPALTGTVDDATATIAVTVDGQTYAGVNHGDGTWSVADNTVDALTNGNYDVSVTATDAVGNVGTDDTTDELSIGYQKIITLGGQGNPSRIVFVDADGSTVVVRAARAGAVVLTLTSANEISNVRTASQPLYRAAGGISLEGIEVVADTRVLFINAHGGSIRGTRVGTITGDATLNTLSAGDADLVNGIDMDGVIGNLLVGNLSGNVTMNGEYSRGVDIHVRYDIEQSIISLRNSDVCHFITGTMIDSTLRVQYKVDAEPSAQADPQAAADDIQIGLISIRGYRGASSPYVVNSNIEATHIGRIYLQQVQLDNNGDNFGIRADQIDLLCLNQDRHSYRYGRKWLADSIDFVVRHHAE
jgi:hypothetical protein